MKTLEYILVPLVSFAIVMIFTPVFRKLAVKIRLVDAPNYRKIHKVPIPLIGGIMIFLSSFIAISINQQFLLELSQIYSLIIGACILLFIGVIDDKLDVRASYKLIIQLAISYMVFSSGIRIDSLYGIFGINEIPYWLQASLTVLVITGSVNAFNLTDGIDGLAACLALLAFIVYTILAIILKNYLLIPLYLAIIGALIGFLRFNLSVSKKIFMGDAGSLFLGFILVVSGIQLIQSAENTSGITLTVATVIGVLIIPVFDSLRVYRHRIKIGYSPFKADKSHLHHLLLSFKIKHITASIVVVLISLLLLIITLTFSTILSLTGSILFILFLFAIISFIISLNNEVQIWRTKIKEMEK